MKKLLKLIGAPMIAALVLATTPATSRAEEYRHRPPPQNHRNNDGAAIAVFAASPRSG